MPDPARELIRLAMERFGNLWPAEAKMLRAAAEGTVADVADREGDEKLTRESAWGCWETWGEHRKIRAELLRWVLVDDEAAGRVAPSGLSVHNAFVEGKPDFCGTSIRSSVFLEKCGIPAGVLAGAASFGGTCSLAGSFVGGLELDGVRVRSGLFFRFGFSSRGPIRLANAKIDGDLDFRGATLNGCREEALTADGASIEGSVYLSQQFCATGTLRLVGAKVAGVVECTDSAFSTADGIALALDRSRVSGALRIHRARAFGQVRLHSARVACGVEIFCVSAGGAANRVAMLFDSAVLGGNMKVQDSRLDGTLSMDGIQCDGSLNLRNTQIHCDGGVAIVADCARIRGGVAMNDKFACRGAVRFVRAEIGGAFEADGATLDNAGRVALNLNGASVGQSVFLRDGCTVSGETCLLRSRVAGDLSLIGGRFDCAGSFAINAERLELAGAVYCDPRGSRPAAAIAGRASFAAAKIARSFMMQGLRVEGDLLLRDCSIGEALCVDSSSQVSGVADFTLCRVEIMPDCKGAWDGIHTLKTSGLSYRALPAGDVTVEDRIAWIRSGMTNAAGTVIYSPQPYQQLASAYARIGRTDEYICVKQAQYRARYEYEKPHALKKWSDLEGWGSWLLRWAIDKLLGCGYDQMRPARWMFALWLIGFGIFALANNANLMVPASDQVLTSEPYVKSRTLPPDYQPLNAWMYSADTMLPIIDFHQERFWLPGWGRECTVLGVDNPVAGQLLQYYLWFHIAAGWILSTLFVVGLSGIVKNEDGKSQDV